MKKIKKFKTLSDDFDKRRRERKEQIRNEPHRGRRFWLWVWFYLSFPFKWILLNIRDIKTAIIFIIVLMVYSASVWVPYLVYFITKSPWWLAAGSTVWIFWLGPGTPFLILCIGTTIGIKAIINKILVRKER